MPNNIKSFWDSPQSGGINLQLYSLDKKVPTCYLESWRQRFLFFSSLGLSGSGINRGFIRNNFDPEWCFSIKTFNIFNLNFVKNFFLNSYGFGKKGEEKFLSLQIKWQYFILFLCFAQRDWKKIWFRNT